MKNIFLFSFYVVRLRTLVGLRSNSIKKQVTRLKDADPKALSDATQYMKEAPTHKVNMVSEQLAEPPLLSAGPSTG